MKSFFLYLLFSLNLSANDVVLIKDKRWNDEWSLHLYNELVNNNHQILKNDIVQSDLNTLSCPNYLNLSSEDKGKFWIYFFAGLSKAESSFNFKVRSVAPKGGHGNYGLLQISKRTGRDFCNLAPEEILIPEKNLSCGLKLMDYQLRGAPTKNGKITKKRTLNKIFTSPMFLWGPLRAKDYRGKKIVTQWMNKHTSMIPGCFK